MMKLDKHRDLDLSKRKSNTRDKVQPEVIKFDLAEIKKHFEDSIKDIEEQFKTIDLLDSKDKEKIDYILRSQIVFLGGSLDFYFHEITQFGIMQMYDEIWQETKPYKNINIKSFNSYNELSTEFDNKSISYMIVPMYKYINDIVTNDYEIVYHLDGLYSYYCLELNE